MHPTLQTSEIRLCKLFDQVLEWRRVGTLRIYDYQVPVYRRLCHRAYKFGLIFVDARGLYKGIPVINHATGEEVYWRRAEAKKVPKPPVA